MKFEKNGWILAGLVWGGFMFITMHYVAPWLRGEEATEQSLAINIPLWIITGIGWGYFMKRYMIKQRLKKEKVEAQMK
jgi:lipid-A-disaccharide synthase-like uncharacterized protein